MRAQYDSSKIGELFIREGLMTQEQVTQAHAAQKELNATSSFGEICTELGFLSPADLATVLSKYHQRLPLGELLVHLDLVTPEQVRFALKQQKSTKKKLGALLVENRWLSDAELVRVLYQQSQLTKRKQEKFDVLVSSGRLSQESLDGASAEAHPNRPCQAA